MLKYEYSRKRDDASMYCKVRFFDHPLRMFSDTVKHVSLLRRCSLLNGTLRSRENTPFKMSMNIRSLLLRTVFVVLNHLYGNLWDFLRFAQVYHWCICISSIYSSPKDSLFLFCTIVFPYCFFVFNPLHYQKYQLY